MNCEASARRLIRRRRQLQVPVAKLLVALASQNDKPVVITVHRRGSRRNFTEFDKLPITGLDIPKTEVIPHRRRDIKPCVLVQIRFWPFVAKHILPVIGVEGSAIFPLCITNSITVTDRKPASFENGLTFALKGIFKPRNHVFRLGLRVTTLQIIIGQGDIERVLPR